jgi:ankyrin repeat protein
MTFDPPANFRSRTHRIAAAFAFVFVTLFAFFVPAAAFSDELPPESALPFLCARGDIAAVQELLFRGANPNGRDGEGCTLLACTVRAGIAAPLSMHLKIADLLIQAGADVNAGVENFRVPVLEFVSRPPRASGRALKNPERNEISEINEINEIIEKNKKRMAPLHWSVEKGEAFSEMTLLLLKKGADPNLSGARGRPLHAAARSGRAGAAGVALLLKWGADARLTDQWGVDPLVSAVTSPVPDAGKVRLLIKAGADLNAVFDWGGLYGISVLIAAAVNGTPEIVQLLLDNGAHAFFRSERGLTAYDYAIAAGREDNAEQLR